MVHIAPRGDIQAEISCIGAHKRPKRLWGKASEYPCITCGNQAYDWAYDGTDPDQLYGRGAGKNGSFMFYSRYPEFYMPMCRECHMARDCASAKRELKEYRTLKHIYRLSESEIRALFDELSQRRESTC